MPPAGPTPPAPPATSGHPQCEVTELFAMLGKPHMLEILSAFRSARGRPLRFCGLEDTLRISPRTLAVRLRVLVAAGLLERRSYRETPPRVEYLATAKTAELYELFTILGRWAGRHSLTPRVGEGTPGQPEAAPSAT